MKRNYKNVRLRIIEAEQKISLDSGRIIDESRKMATFLKDILHQLSEEVKSEGFTDEAEEIEFFRKVKPEIQGKLLYYNKVYRIEIACPTGLGNIHEKYFRDELKKVRQKYKDHICNTEFYKYYRSGCDSRDQMYFTRGKIDFNGGLKSHVFESDPNFSTYYDYKVSRIIENDLLYEYLLMKLNSDSDRFRLLADNGSNEPINWTDSKSALIELIYALYATECITNGNVGIRKIALALQALFNVQLGDVHHAFHRMKERNGNRTLFLERLKFSLEEYMDKEIV